MNTIKTKRSPFHRGDDLDGLLRDFFRSEMPDPWPKADQPDILPLPARAFAWPRILRSRFALAASIALLILGQAVLSGALDRGQPEQPNSHKIISNVPDDVGSPKKDYKLKESLLQDKEKTSILIEVNER